MKFADALIKAYQTRWSYVNSFSVEIGFNENIKEEIGWSNADDENLNLNIISINTPQLTNSAIEVYVADRWRIHNGRYEVFNFDMTIRDQDQMKLYTKFLQAHQLQQYNYFDNIKMSPIIYKDPDYYKETKRKIITLEDTMITSISQVQFSNTTENQIAEFSVQFKSATPKVEPLPTQ